jgi:hypothetical protein
MFVASRKIDIESVPSVGVSVAQMAAKSRPQVFRQAYIVERFALIKCINAVFPLDELGDNIRVALNRCAGNAF